MKKLIILACTIFLSSSFLFAQTKAGRGDTTQHASYYSCPMHPEVTGHEPGKCPKCGMELNISSKEKMKAKESRNYVCPIHPDVKSNAPGQCPKCNKPLALLGKEKMKADVMKLYSCKNHPDVTSNKSGKCPTCGMALTKTKKL